MDALLKKIHDDQLIGVLDYKWLIRGYLADNQLIKDSHNHRHDYSDPNKPDRIITKNKGKDKVNDIEDQIQTRLKTKTKNKNKNNLQFVELLHYSWSPFRYLDEHSTEIKKDRSLSAITQLCVDSHHVANPTHVDLELVKWSTYFNALTHSARALHMCYDCGTVARGVFFKLIQEYRQTKTAHKEDLVNPLQPSEIKRIQMEYSMDAYPPQESIQRLWDNICNIQHNCLFMCALQFGEKFGHIYIIEKIYPNSKNKNKKNKKIKKNLENKNKIKINLEKPRYRIFQSCFNSYLLIDYIEHMNYINPEVELDIQDHIINLKDFMTPRQFTTEDYRRFCQEFCFYPTSRILADDKRAFASTYVIF
jgi:hypothetical protein